MPNKNIVNGYPRLAVFINVMGRMKFLVFICLRPHRIVIEIPTENITKKAERNDDKASLTKYCNCCREEKTSAGANKYTMPSVAMRVKRSPTHPFRDIKYPANMTRRIPERMYCFGIGLFLDHLDKHLGFIQLLRE